LQAGHLNGAPTLRGLHSYPHSEHRAKRDIAFSAGFALVKPFTH
jgi:hypothetical protein